MEAVVDQLPDRPVSVAEAYDLMQPPRKGVGYVIPLREYQNRCVCIIVEHKGAIKGVAYTESGWEPLETTEEDIDGFFFDEEIDAKTIARLSRESEEKLTGKYADADYYHPNVQTEAPVGFQAKCCLRHRPLSPTDFNEARMWPQINNVVPLMGSRSEGIVSIAVSENSLDFTKSVVFLYYHPEYETWRIHDSFSPKEVKKVADHMYREVAKRVKSLYDDAEIINDSTRKNQYLKGD